MNNIGSIFLKAVLLLGCSFTNASVFAGVAKRDFVPASLNKWAVAYFSYLDKKNIAMDPNVSLPMVWAFSPQGQMKIKLSPRPGPKDELLGGKASEDPIEEFAKNFPPSTAPTVEKQLDLFQTLEFLSEVTKDRSEIEKPTSSQWVVIYYISDNTSSNSQSTQYNPTYTKAIDTIEASHGDKVKIIRIKLTSSD